ncbi:MAG: hypothetical protein WD030_05685 [Pirellulales bacterium]
MTATIRCFALAALPVGLLLAGCRGDDGLYQRSGVVTFAGRAVPDGELRIAPDTAKGNQGPGVVAMIEDGQFRTANGKGTAAGPHVLTVLGFDGNTPDNQADAYEFPRGRPLFEPIRLELDLPANDSSHNIELPVALDSGHQ